MKKILLVLTLLTSIFLIAACTEQAPSTGIETPTTETPTATPSVCGDGECDNSEMCIIDTLQSACADDCGPCPPSLYVEPLSCDSGCEQTGKNEFTIKVPGSIKTRVANLGEAIANKLESDFRCYANNNKVVQHVNLKNYKGVLFEDYFELNGKPVDEVKLLARPNDGSKSVYKLDLKRWEQDPLEDFEIVCNFEFITHSPITNEKQTYTIKFQK